MGYGNIKITEYALKVSVFIMLKLDTIWKKKRRRRRRRRRSRRRGRRERLTGKRETTKSMRFLTHACTDNERQMHRQRMTDVQFLWDELRLQKKRKKGTRTLIDGFIYIITYCSMSKGKSKMYFLTNAAWIQQ